MPQQQNHNQHVGMVMMPEPQIDFSTLNIGGNNWGVPNGMNSFTQHQVFAVLEVPEPAEPIDVAALSGKNEDSVVDAFTAEEPSKYDHPAEIAIREVEQESFKGEAVIERSTVSAVEESVPAVCEFDESDPAFTLYANTSSTSSAMPAKESSLTAPIEKLAAHFELVVASDADIQSSSERLEKLCARMDSSCRKLDALMASFDL